MTSAESAICTPVDQDSVKKEAKEQGVETIIVEPEKTSESSEGLPRQRTRSSQRWMKLRTTVQLTGAMTASKKASLKREDSFLKRFSTRQVPEVQDTFDNDDDADNPPSPDTQQRRRRKRKKHRRSVINPDGNLYFYWLGILSTFVLYYLWSLIVRQAFPELQEEHRAMWLALDILGDIVYILDFALQFRTGYLEQGLIVDDGKKLAVHYIKSEEFLLDTFSILPLNLLPLDRLAILRFPRFVKIYRVYKYYYMVESRTVYPNIWRVLNLVHILLLLAHWFGCFYYMISEAEGFTGDWAYPFHHEDDAYRTLTRKYLGSVYWSTLTLTTIGDLPTPYSNSQYVFTIASYLIGVFIFATINIMPWGNSTNHVTEMRSYHVYYAPEHGQVGNVITNRNASRLEFERLLDSAKLYMRHHKVPRDMQRRVQRWYDYSWSRGRIQGGGDISSALRVLPDKLKTELALHVNLTTLKKVSMFQECQPEFLHDLVLKMRASIFTPGDMICRRGEVAREMFIIADGILEVISETGKVLTTMKAGDFFGEIGILNLDGLNKRTADVRSVGYSELFSLSREDVLGAMKDYPEARELLQSMGKKRLAEAKRIANQHKKKAEEKKAGASKLLNEVKVIKDVISKSKIFTVRKMQNERSPLHSNENLNKDVSPARGKRKRRFLRRMPRVSSDEDSAPSKPRRALLSVPTHFRRDSSEEQEVIGAGLPLLQRLKLLREKEERERKRPKVIEDKKSPVAEEKIKPPLCPKVETLKNVRKCESEPRREEQVEVIGAGLPLFQRLKLLKQKEEAEAKKLTEEKKAVESRAKTLQETTDEPSAKLNDKKAKTIDLSSIVPKSKTSEASNKTANSRETSKILPSRQGSEYTRTTYSVEPISSSAKNTHSVATEGLQENPVSIDKGMWGSVADAVKHEPKLVREILPKIYKSKGISALKQRFGGAQAKIKQKEKKQVSIVVSPRRIASMEEAAPKFPRSRLASDPSPPKMRVSRPKDLSLNDASNLYTSIDDLSPEFTVLPFVKRLKILNERQKLAALEQQVRTVRSKSVDFTTAQASSNQQPAAGSSLESVFESNQLAPRPVLRMPSSQTDPNIADAANWIPTFLNMMTAALQGRPAPSMTELERAKNVLIQQINHPRDNEITKSPNPVFPSISLDNSIADELPLSPEGNETLERRSLKSILKRLSSKDLSHQLAQCGISGRKLLRSQTVEGYAARHSKLLKSVTFQRDTLPSPPPLDAEDQKRSQSAPPGLSDDFPGLHAFPEGLNFRLPENPVVDIAGKLELKKKAGQNNSLAALLNNVVDKDADERLSDLLIGLKQIMQTRLADVELRFQEKLNSLQKEIQEKNQVIAELETKLIDSSEEVNPPADEEAEPEVVPQPVRRQCSVVTFYSNGMSDDDEELIIETQPEEQEDSDEDDNERENLLVRGKSCDSIIYRSNSNPNFNDLEETDSFCPSSWDEYSEDEVGQTRDLPPVLLPIPAAESGIYVNETETRFGAFDALESRLYASRDTVVQIDSDDEMMDDFEEVSSPSSEEDLGENWELALLAKEMAKQNGGPEKPKYQRKPSSAKIDRLKRKAETGCELTESEHNLLEQILPSELRALKRSSEKSRSLDEPHGPTKPVSRGSILSRVKQNIPESKSLSPSGMRSFQKLKHSESVDRSSGRGILQRFMSIDSSKSEASGSRPPSAILKFRRNLKRSMTSSISKLTDILEDEQSQKRSISKHNINKSDNVEMVDFKSGETRPVNEFEPLLGAKKRPT